LIYISSLGKRSQNNIICHNIGLAPFNTFHLLKVCKSFSQSLSFIFGVKVGCDECIVDWSIWPASTVTHLRKEPHCHPGLTFLSHNWYQLRITTIIRHIPPLFLHPSEHLSMHLVSKQPFISFQVVCTTRWLYSNF
jgi:hypothetical protein